MYFVIDDAINNCDKLRELALQQSYKKSADYRWPGFRASIPEEIKIKYTQFVCSRLGMQLKLYQGFFQYVDKSWMEGTCHYDQSAYTSISYLNYNPEENSGTELYDEGYYCNYYGDMINDFDPIKRKFYKSRRNIFGRNYYKRKYKEFNSNFKDPIIVENKFNRTFIFDSHRLHRAQNFFGKKLSDARLTMICFFVL
jgi:hypothetical protein